MTFIRHHLTGILAFLRQNRDEHLHWQLDRQAEIAELRQTQALAEQALAAQLSKQAEQLAHELAVSKTRHQNELAMVKIQCKQDLKDYQEYLQALDRLKSSLRNSYVHLPEAVAFTIHHHAKQLLNKMWEERQPEEKLKTEMQLLQFMSAVHEDSQACLQGNGTQTMPQKALACIDADQRTQIG